MDDFNGEVSRAEVVWGTAPGEQALTHRVAGRAGTHFFFFPLPPFFLPPGGVRPCCPPVSVEYNPGRAAVTPRKLTALALAC